MSQLPISDIVNISVSQAPAGIGPFNVNNLSLFTAEAPASAFASGYKVYLNATDVGNDFGSTSKTFQMASAIFAQTPNPLAGNGSLIVIPFLTGLTGVVEVQSLTFPDLPASGTYKLNYGALVTSALQYNASASDLQTALRALSGLSTMTVTGDEAAGFVLTFTGVSGDFPALVVSDNSLKGSDGGGITPDVSITTHGVVNGSTETLLAAILRTQGAISYCGVIKENAYATNELVMASNYVQSQNMLLFAASADDALVEATTGLFWLIMNAGNSHTRCLLYLKSDYDAANLMAAAYAGRALSVDFSGSNTTTTMQLKSLNTITGDTGMDQTTYGKCQIAGVDIYPLFQGVAKVVSFGANRFFDQIYNQTWFVTGLAVAGFNALATSSTKLPQTEQGVSVLKTAYQTVCEQAKANLYCAPGSWTGDTFGNLADFLRNIEGIGYYIYSSPITSQLTADRVLRKAPLIQIALKEAGAIHTSNVLVNINA